LSIHRPNDRQGGRYSTVGWCRWMGTPIQPQPQQLHYCTYTELQRTDPALPRRCRAIVTSGSRIGRVSWSWSVFVAGDIWWDQAIIPLQAIQSSQDGVVSYDSLPCASPTSALHLYHMSVLGWCSVLGGARGLAPLLARLAPPLHYYSSKQRGPKAEWGSQRWCKDMRVCLGRFNGV
jgi:hypothetical protein